MTFYFIYEPDWIRVMPFVLMDGRVAITEMRNKTGNEIKAFVDSKVALLSATSILYRIETELGVIAGFVAVEVNIKDKTGTLLMKEIRPSFKEFTEQIGLEITNFIQGLEWKQDFLF